MVMKKLVINANTLWSIVQFRLELIKWLCASYEVVCIGDREHFTHEAESNLEALGVKCIHLPIARKGMNVFVDFFYCLRLFFLYKRLAPDIVMHYTIKPIIYGSRIASLLGISSIAVVTGLGSSLIHQGYKTSWIRWLYRKALLHVKYVFFLNQEDKDYFIHHAIVLASKSVILPGEGIDPKRYLPSPPHFQRPITFLMVARLLKDKGIIEYIEAIRICKQRTLNAHFLLVGAFDDANPSAIRSYELQQWIEEGLIEYLGEQHAMQEMYAKADVVVLPSYREGLSRVLLEACCSEKFLITSDIAGCKELCYDGKNGFLVPCGDAKALSQAMMNAIDFGKEFLHVKGAWGRQWVEERYSYEHVFTLYEKHLNTFFL